MLYHLTQIFARGLSERLLLAYYDTPLRDSVAPMPEDET